MYVAAVRRWRCAVDVACSDECRDKVSGSTNVI
jgi:hypothetical protein